MKIIVLIAFVCTAVISYAQIPSYIPSNGLVGWWPFNGNANDESGNGNNGTNNGATLTTDRFGNNNASYNFQNNIISIPHNSSLGFLVNSGFTVSIWCNISNLTNVLQIIGKRANGSPNFNWQIAYGGGNGPNFGSGTGPGLYNGAFSPDFLLTNNWYHIVGKFDNGLWKIYVNGILKGSNNSANVNTDSNTPISIGNSGNFEPFYGSLDDIGIWNRALTEQEILALYQGCQQSITAHPTNQSVTLSGGTTASFNVATNATNPTYQWQTNLGVGFQNLSNVGQYSGVNTDNLTVSNLTLTNDNQAFRCLISEAGCLDTSDIATLSIIDDASIISQIKSSLVLSPNPISNDFSISGIEQIVSLLLKDVSGKFIKTFDVQDKNHSMTNVTSGVYFLEVCDENRTYMIKVIKE